MLQQAITTKSAGREGVEQNSAPSEAMAIFPTSLTSA